MRYPHETPDEYVRRVVFRPYLNTAYHYGPRTLLEANALAILGSAQTRAVISLEAAPLARGRRHDAIRHQKSR